MKRSKIAYCVTLDDQIKIIGFENVASISELQKMFGDEVVRLYRKSSNSYVRSEYRKEIVEIRVNGKETKIIVGGLYSKEAFSKIISYMKKAGENLKGIATFVDCYVNKEIVI